MKRWQHNALKITAIGLFGAAVLHRDVLRDVAFHWVDTTQESLIEDAVSQAYGEDVAVRCLSEAQLDDRLWGLGGWPDSNKEGFSWWPWPIIWLDEKRCQGIEDFANNPDKARSDLAQLLAVQVLTQTVSHQEFDDWSDDRAACGAVQLSDGLATTLGASFEEGQRVRQAMAEIVSMNILGSPSEYNLRLCYDGGPFDIDPRPGIFPTEPPK